MSSNQICLIPYTDPLMPPKYSFLHLDGSQQIFIHFYTKFENKRKKIRVTTGPGGPWSPGVPVSPGKPALP